MQLPRSIQAAIEERVNAAGFAAVKRAAAALSDAYREGRSAPQIPTAERIAAYLVTRMPATYAANASALEQIAPLLAGRTIASVLDAGAGPGAASVAARERFPTARFTLIERDSAMAEPARNWLPESALLPQDVARMEAFPPHDLVLASYALSEMGSAGLRTAKRLWEGAAVALVILEPGTPKGFAFIREIREALLAAGADMLAPCPAPMSCPMSGHDWCHFAARVERSSLHRRIKEGALGYEDEKFSYVAFARERVALPSVRIIRHPQHQPGLITLETCTPGGLESQRVLKRDRDAFRRARRASWGDALSSDKTAP